MPQPTLHDTREKVWENCRLKDSTLLFLALEQALSPLVSLYFACLTHPPVNFDPMEQMDYEPNENMTINDRVCRLNKRIATLRNK